MDVNDYRTVVLGGGMVAGYAAKELAESGLKPGELGIVSADTALPYERPPLSKSFLAGKDNEQSVLINTESFYREHGIGIHLNCEIDRIDLAGKRLVEHGGQEFRFDKLILATGARPRTLNVPGADRENVLYLRSMSDSARLRDALKNVKKVVVIGGGFIGMEVASQSAQQGRDTTMVFPQDRVWKNFFTPSMSMRQFLMVISDCVMAARPMKLPISIMSGRSECSVPFRCFTPSMVSRFEPMPLIRAPMRLSIRQSCCR